MVKAKLLSYTFNLIWSVLFPQNMLGWDWLIKAQFYVSLPCDCLTDDPTA